MTKLQKAGNVITGLIMAAFGILLFAKPAPGLLLVAMVTSITFTLRGIQTLLYYLTMARFMVGGKAILYCGIIYLDVGLFTATIVDTSAFYIILYITALHLFSGVVDVLRAREARQLGSPTWKSAIIYGSTSIALAAAVIIGWLVMHSALIAVYVYAGGLIYSAGVRIVIAFRKTAIVYIQ